MASQVDICNLALTSLGAAPIISIDDDSEPASLLRLIYDLTLENELRINTWRFSIKRTTLPALATAPAYGYSKQYALPSDYLRAIQVGEHYVCENLRNYVTDKSTFYTLEGNLILTDEAAPLKFRYITNGLTPDEYDSAFVMVIAARLAAMLAEPITQSNSKKAAAKQEYKDALMAALGSGLVEVPAEAQQHDSWILARI